MFKRQLGVVLVIALLLTGLLGGVATATEGGAHEVPEYSEILESSSDTAREFLPEAYERPGFFDWFVYPLLGVGVLATLAVLLRYLVFQPKFAEEDRKRARR